eukprot:m.241106 g.241106  ORF g.241106 m.241106 type:complete len:139 (+) comp16086_c0_seq6:733-1149(+)
MDCMLGHRPAVQRECPGTDVEMVTDGGEVGFVSRMIEDSLIIGKNIVWYTSMLGKQKNLLILKNKLESRGVPTVQTSILTQGRTMRWAIAWSFYTLENAPEMLDKSKKRKRKKGASCESRSFSLEVISSSIILYYYYL